MPTVTVRIPTPLRSFTSGADEVQTEGTTVGEALAALRSSHEGLVENVLAADGELRNFVNVFVGSNNVRSLQGLKTPLSEGDVLAIVPAVAGGAS
ncbi:MAG: MoaD/ThiS family protein [Gammaproteobacteria bacterium]|nr:MoaD/ThiS family protein [Gammaproteobacteria bacterium]NIR83600.1 MoaD/ThiS family protein [Gammaproteobacteria bacterium]NIR91573.1 MoaD/ThiS family protein [Gammaproteobacteria bacterium]NIU04762.1 MoaD/ThiS family protein [Gammaproteobacteria bacterium]NIV53112.1 MoaD family protein [Gammaproteobacteria bacterium]